MIYLCKALYTVLYRGADPLPMSCDLFPVQVWQWIRHQTRLEDDGTVVTCGLVRELTQEVMGKLREVTHCQTVR